jgi:3-isopropylmalate dehydrogenase
VAESVKHRLAVLGGDYIGPEVTQAALRVLSVVAARYRIDYEEVHLPFGGNALDDFGKPLPDVTAAAIEDVDAVLLGAAGGPVGDHPWNRQPRELRVESGILQLRRQLGAFANLRPVRVFPGLERLSPLREEVAAGTDMLIIRELTGGIYFGKPSSVSGDRGVSTMVYDRHEVERIGRVACETARLRQGRVMSIDKANVLDVSQFWRNVIIELQQREFPDVELDHLYVDNAAMQIVRDPQAFDVIVTGNLFGDILSDLAAVIPGSLGLLPSASLGGRTGLYEPVHGSAPDIAGTDSANPTAAILSAAMLLRYSWNQEQAALEIEAAVQAALALNPTRDLGGSTGTEAFTNTVLEQLGQVVADV